MLDLRSVEFAGLPEDEPPLLLVVVDTEEDFDWAKPHARANTSVGSIAAQHRAQDIFDRYGVKPIYVVDYPIVTSDAAVRVLRGFLDEGRCEIGAHLHPWVNPPHDEPVNTYNSYPGNLPAPLERAKLERLTQAIEERFGKRPTAYRAGRFGAGPATGDILEELGYEVDLSIVARGNLTGDGGPDYRAFSARPYWFGRRRRLLEVPVSAGFTGVLAGWGPTLYPALAGALGVRLRIPAVLARLGVMERVRLTPEGIDHAAHRRLTRALLAQGCRIFSFMYHSPSLVPGNTPYVRDAADLRRFLEAVERYLAFFVNDVGGRPTTPSALYRELSRRRVPDPQRVRQK